MIPPVDKPVTGSEFDDEDDIFRPEWMKWYYHRYEAATQLMDPEQNGWYMKLLMHAATQGEPPGHLPEDDEELRYIAGVEDLAALAYDMFGIINLDISTAFHERREKRWRRVLSKFKKSSTVPGTIYNRTLVSTLREAKRRSKFATEAARGMQTMRKAKRKEERKLAAGAKQELSGSSAGALSLSLSSYKDDIEATISLENNSSQEKEGILSLDESSSEVESLGEGTEKKEVSETNYSENPTKEIIVPTTQESQDKTTKENTPIPGKRKRSPESFFDKSKWKVSPKMKAHLLTKYQSDGIEEGDVDYLAEKFALVHYNSKYSNWAMAFYNFIDNQLTKYGYEFGMYKRRGKRNEQRPATRPWETQREGSGDPSHRHQFEPAADRNARIEREADEATRRLRGGSSGTDTQGPTGLSLTTEDLG